MNDPMKLPDVLVTLAQDARGPIAVFKIQAFFGTERFDAYRECLDGATYISSNRTNTATLDKVLPILHRLKAADFTGEITLELRTALQSLRAQQQVLTQAATERVAQLDEMLKGRGVSLYPYQKVGIEWLAARTGALLADEPGVGKTVQALTAMPVSCPVLVVCPSAVKGTWLNEATRWRPDILRVEVLAGRDSFRWPARGEMLITNYDILPDVDRLGDAPEGCIPNTTLVFDEAHALKNYKAKRTIRARAIAIAVRRLQGRTWNLTATPLLNAPSELWSVLQAVGCAQEAFGSYKEFFRLFGGATDKWGGTKWSSLPDDSIPERMRRVSLRREKKDVLSELPDKTYKILEVDLDKKTLKELDKFWKNISALGIKIESAQDLSKLTKGDAIQIETVSSIRANLAMAKVPALLEIVEEFETAGEPVLVFSCHRGPIDIFKERPGWATITGENSRDASDLATRFQAGEFKGLAGTIQAMGVGITLTRATNEIFVDRDWTPALNDQAEDRAHRIGQENALTITILVGDHAMDKHVLKVLMKKEKIIERSVEASSLGKDEQPKVSVLTEDQLRAFFADTVSDAQLRPAYEFLAPVSPRERWVVASIELLKDLSQQTGWDHVDLAMLTSLATTLMHKQGLTDKQWELAARICVKYVKQLGEMPAEEFDRDPQKDDGL